MKDMFVAPILLFTYNRLEHTKKTIEALRQNTLAKESRLFIYSDGGKDASSWERVNQVRSYLKSVYGFKKITIIERDSNWGLAKNIINGVTEIVNVFGKVIVLEDDIVTSPSFLNFMNSALDFYENEKKVWHISGWNYPVAMKSDEDTFAWRMMNCWGWATWLDRWKFYKKNPKDLINKFTKYDKYKFDLDGVGGFWSQVLQNSTGVMDTWAIFWYATIFENNGLCINPMQSFVENIGFDGTGTNTQYRAGYTSTLNSEKDIKFEKNLQENKEIINRIKEFLLLKKNGYEIFSNNLAHFLSVVDGIKQNPRKKYIIYGAGNLCHLLLPYIADQVHFIVDQDIKLHNKKIYSKEIKGVEKLKSTNNLFIIITVLGREKEITHLLMNKYSFSQSQIIYFNFFEQ